MIRNIPELLTEIKSDIKLIQAFDTLEQEHIDDALTWMTKTNDVFRIKKPDLPPKHLVSYFVLVDTKHKSILLCDHIKAQLWLPSGGHVEHGEHPADTVGVRLSRNWLFPLNL